MSSIEEKLVKAKKIAIYSGTSTKTDGNMAYDLPFNQDGQAARNLSAYLRKLNLVLEQITLLVLPVSHSLNIAICDKSTRRGRIILRPDSPEITHFFYNKAPYEVKNPWESIDACIGYFPNIFFAILHADCAPVLLYDSENNNFALMHCGVLGTLGGLIPKTIQCLAEVKSKPANLQAWIGPCISHRNYDLQASRHWPILQNVFRVNPQRFSLKSTIIQDLLKAGVRNIEVSPYCTDNSGLFFSNHLASGQTGRNITVIGI